MKQWWCDRPAGRSLKGKVLPLLTWLLLALSCIYEGSSEISEEREHKTLLCLWLAQEGAVGKRWSKIRE